MSRTDKPLKAGHFDICKAITQANGKIYIAPLDNITNMRKNRHGTVVSIGVGLDCINDVMAGRYVGGLLLIDKDEYFATKARLEEES